MRHRPALRKLWFYQGKDKNVKKFNANGSEVPPEKSVWTGAEEGALASSG